MKIKHKVILDICMAILFVLCMKYKFTGNFLHEVLGGILLLGFIVHVSINHKYYKVMFQSKNVSGWGGKQIVSFIINCILLFAIPVMIFSSIVISKDVFCFMKLDLGQQRIWRMVHILCAVILFLSSMVHLLFHMPLFKGMLWKNVGGQDFEKVWSVGSKAVAILMSVFVIFTSTRAFQSVVEIKGHHEKRHQEQGYIKNKKPERQDEIIEDSPEEEQVLNPDEYLRGLFCDGCGKHCSLLYPRCGVGVNQAEKAKEAYILENGTTNGVK